MAEGRQLDIARKPRDIVKPAPIVGSAPSPRLAKKRLKRRKQMLIALAFVVSVLGGAAVWGMWQPAVRITRVTITGSDAADLKTIADEALSGTYFHLLPHNSIFLAPTGKIRAAILAAHAEIGAVSTTRMSFSALSITVLPRVNAYLWCGTDGATATSTTSVAPSSSSPCYDTDPEGFIFMSANSPVASSTGPVADMPLQSVRIYAPADSPEPIRAHVLQPARIPVALQFSRTLAGFGAEPVSLVIRGDEGDFYLPSGTRITFVLGDEHAAAARAAAALPQLSLTDGSVQYIDLRFDGKVYVKKAAASSAK